MQRRSQWVGWITFAGWMLAVIGALDVIEGVIAISRGAYYVLTPAQIIVFDLRTWGWVTLIWGVVVMLAGVGLLSRATWARWLAVLVSSLNLIVQLGFIGDRQYPLWALTVVGLSVVVIYALIVRWDESMPGIYESDLTGTSERTVHAPRSPAAGGTSAETPKPAGS